MKNKLLEKTFLILELITSASEPVSLKELADSSDLPASTVSRITGDLIEAGYVEKADYRRFEPALGLIRLGQNTTNNLKLTNRINPMIRSRVRALDVNGALAGLERDQLVYLFRSDVFAPPEESGLPCMVPLCRSHIAVMILAKSRSLEDAVKLLSDSQNSSHNRNRSRIEPEEFRRRLTVAAEQGFWHHIEPNGNWNISFPLEYDGRVYGLSLYGRYASRQNFDRLLFEASLLTSQVREELGC